MKQSVKLPYCKLHHLRYSWNEGNAASLRKVQRDTYGRRAKKAKIYVPRPRCIHV